MDSGLGRVLLFPDTCQVGEIRTRFVGGGGRFGKIIPKAREGMWREEIAQGQRVNPKVDWRVSSGTNPSPRKAEHCCVPKVKVKFQSNCG